MSPTAKMLAREAKRRDFAVQEAKATSGWTNTKKPWNGPNYVAKPTHFYPSGPSGSSQRVKSSSQQNLFSSKMRKGPKGKRPRL